MRERQFGHALPAPMIGDTLIVEWPEGTGYLRSVFDFLSDQRGSKEHGLPMRLRHSEVEAGLRILDEEMEGWELRALAAMDAAYCNALSAVIADDARRHTGSS